MMHNATASLELIVYTASACSLCDTAREQLEPLSNELAIDVQWVAIDNDPDLEAAYRERIPYGVIGGRAAFKYHVDAERLRRLVNELRS